MSPEELQKQDEYFRLCTRHAADAIIIIDEQRCIRFMNPAAEELLDQAAHQMIARKFPFPIGDGGLPAVETVHSKDGTWVAEMHISPVEVDGERLYVTSLRDVTDRERMRNVLRTTMLLDELTGLFNRRGFLALTEHQLRLANRSKRALLVLLLDVDGIKSINETHGHLVGDLALVECSCIFRKTFRASDIIGRVGGDQFAVTAIETDTNSMETPLRRLQKKVQESNALGTRSYSLSFRVGLKRYNPEKPCSIEDLLRQAEADLAEIR